MMNTLISGIRIAAAAAVLSFTTLSIMAVPPAAAQTSQRIAAVVNDDIISNQDLVERVSLALVFSGLPNTEGSRQQIAPRVLQRMIDEQLQMREAERLGVQVSENELIQALNDIAAPNGMSAQEMLTALAGEGISAETVRNQARTELLWVKMIRQQIRPRVTVSEAQLDIAMAAGQEDGEEEIRLSEIVLPVYDRANEEQVRSEILELRDAIREGADFANLAKQFSISSTAGSGGDLGWLPLDRLSPLQRNAVANLGEGQLTDAIRTPDGIVLMLVQGRRQAASIAANPDARRLAQLYLPYGEGGEASALRAQREAEILRQRLQSCAGIITAASQLGLPASGDLGWIIPADMPADLANIVNRLSVGEVSQPVQSANGVHIIGVCQAGGEGQEDAQRAEVRRLLERGQIERLASRYLRDLRQEAFLDVRVRF